MAKLTTVRVLLAVAAQKNWHMSQLDINNAFLNDDFYEEVYMDLPLGYPAQDGQHVCKLHNSLYGLRQASGQWFQNFFAVRLKSGFQQSTTDYSLFYKGSNESLILLPVYMDDIIIANRNQALIS